MSLKGRIGTKIVTIMIIIVILVCSINTTLSLNHYHLTGIVTNSTGLSVTSFLFNPTRKYSNYISRIFGENSIQWNITSEDTDNLDEESIKSSKSASDNFLHHFKLPTDALWPKCSIEILGFAPLDESTIGEDSNEDNLGEEIRNNPILSPLKTIDKHSKPIVGNAKLLVGSSGKKNDAAKSVEWHCFYRAVFENWRSAEDSHRLPNFWAILFYCVPPRNDRLGHSCAQFVTTHDDYTTVDMKLSLRWKQNMNNAESKSKNATAIDLEWVVSFSTYKDQSGLEKLRNFDFSSSVDNLRQDRLFQRRRAICTCLPYTSNDSGRVEANKAILFEWLRYYSNLDYTVIVYDRDGLNAEGLMDSAYVRKLSRNKKQKTIISNHLLYYNYTILGRLDPSTSRGKYDNNEGVTSDLIKFDNDHTFTLTQCRFDAKARYGIETVIVADFDEFLFCPIAPIDAATDIHDYVRKQARFQHNYFRSMKDEGIEQLLFNQRIVAPILNKGFQPKLDGNSEDGVVRNCVIEQIADREGNSIDLPTVRSKHKVTLPKGSVFSCFSSYENHVTDFYEKSVHLQHSCPLTSDHHACPVPDREVTTYDCECDALFSGTCAFIHISLRDSDYLTEDHNQQKESRTKEWEAKEISELWYIANAY